MIEKILKNFKMFELKEDLEFIFEEYTPSTYKVSLLDTDRLRKYIEFIPKAEEYITVKKRGWKEEALKFFKLPNNLFLVLYFPKDTKAVKKSCDYPFILVERKVKEEETVNRWEPVAWLYYYYRVYNGLYLTSKASTEGIIELVLKIDNWEVEI
jgi:hypothetical protein